MERNRDEFEKRNLLAAETSPYLLQHAENPVHWRPWGQAALTEAKDRDCPILLSVGYAACHWCHVMAHESFEDEGIAAIMNSLYVNVKVDREERPDIDQIYMAALSSMGEQGGWPLTMFLTPQASPFWGGTYFPKQPAYGRPGFGQILQAIHHAWTNKRKEIGESAATLTGHIQQRLSRNHVDSTHPDDLLPRLASAILPIIDMDSGGLRGAPKFPNAPFMSTLWLEWLQSGIPDYRNATLLSLSKMLSGGIYDHVGGGLARYSTDAEWMIPHFEKMLYDNAQLLRLLNWAYAETGDEIFRARIEGTVTWLLREMRTTDGLASSLDADSDGEEGLFYTWTPEQLHHALGDSHGDLRNFFSLGTQAQWEGAPVLYQNDVQSDASARNPGRANALRLLLLADREARRKRPARDDKVLTDWNGLTVQALAEAGRSLERPEWIEIAAAIFEQIASSTDQQGRLPHSVRGERRLYPAFSSDYAAMINAAVSLHEATGKTHYLDRATSLLELLDQWYGDETGYGHFLTASDSSDVPIRMRGDVDEAVPSANSQIIEAIARLASASGDFGLAQRAEAIAERALARIQDLQFGQAGVANAAAIARNPIKLVIIDDAKGNLVAVANRLPDPRRIDLMYRVGQEAISEFPDGTLPRTDEPGAWLCRNQTCLPVIKDPDELERALKERSNPA